MPQLENGYTRIANELLDAIAAIRIPGEAMQVFLVVMRKTYGFQKKSDTIALTQFSDATGLNKQAVCRAVKKLEQMNIIVIKKDNVIKKDKRLASEYTINKAFENWRPLSKKITLPKKVKNVIEKDNLSLSKKIPSKETISKEIIPVEKSPGGKSENSVADETTPKINAWGIWVDVNREMKKADPIPTGVDTKASKELLRLIGGEKLKKVMAAFLADNDPFLIRQGHSLRLISARVNKYINKASAPVDEIHSNPGLRGF
jgi:phage replication O-like protein O